MSRATENELDKVHALVADLLKDELERARDRAEANPEDGESAVPPQLLGQALKFLSLTGVTAPASSKRVSNLEDQLAEIGVDLDNVVAITRPK